MKYTQRGSIEVKTSYNFVEQLLVVHIQDTGYGIEEADLSKLFKRFSRIEDPKKLNKESIGLGLSICKAIVTANGG